ncbi:hypothetical protein EOS93_25190 [Rhizobium sp. RMa-01]|uniref:hypothetical protein n=1 Tax=unclassified Rhizobium TaxID=2613769 RepID=UPI0008DA070C|nr:MULTISPECIES: hypothetical protein [unclassified Rhizobium]OHV24944.1 hypothetical protein BBJ66_22645 [Rhizobium sp. RSm-3]RVU08351.1 hypothetical protein EOS93_25190 [Rhizobium sp. RMa-01]
MASVVSICNLALSNVGKQNISDLTEASAEARACNQFYVISRDRLLQSFHWSAAGKSASLAEVTNDKPGAWKYAYTRPTDCLQIRWIRRQYVADPADDCVRFDLRSEFQSPYEIEGDKLYCNLSPCLLRYTFRLTDPTKFSPLFIDALSWHLAARIAMPLTRDPKVRADALAVAKSTQVEAEAADAGQVAARYDDVESEFVAVRDHG